MQGMSGETTAAFEHPIGFSANLREIGYVLKHLDSPDPIEAFEAASRFRKRQGHRIGMHQRDLRSNQWSQQLPGVSEIGPDKINNQHTHIWPRCRKPPPVPTPAPSDVKDQSSLW